MSQHISQESVSLYCLLDLGIKIDKNDKDLHDFVFTYKKEHFIAGNFEKKVIAKEVISGTAKLDEFFLQVRTDHTDPNTEYLSLFFNPSDGLQNFSSIRKERVVSHAFQTIAKNDEQDSWFSSDANEVEMDVDNESRNEVQLLYDRLKRAHAGTNTEECDLSYLQHDNLHPELRPYQLKAVKWMIERETKRDFVNIPYIELASERFPGVTFFMDRFTMEIYDKKPEMRNIPAGGLLCDEMGLGKTVEMLSLILHRKREGNFFQLPEFQTEEMYYQNFVVNSKTVKIHCICFRTSSKLKMIMCNECETAQHLDCVMQHAKFYESYDHYECPDCWKKSGRIIESKATLIVSPLAIKYQWMSEIQRHVKDSSFRVFIYDGVKNSGWISPRELASYDVVLTDYNVLSSEIYFTKITERHLRRPSKCAKPVSPLPMIQWYRTCLDEAQMVEIPTNQCARMVNSLPAIYRWAVTGTPIEKHVSTLYGLVFFLGYDPFNQMSVWNYYLRQYNEGSYGALIKILQKVMWRTCKADVMDEIAIPPQSNVVHYVQMSDLQRFFYRTEHSQFRQVFHEKAAKVVSGSLASGLSTTTMKILMEPLRKLRQDCTVPSIFSKTTGFDAQKKLVTPTELNNHMIKNTEVELKTCLRTISSSLNGLAACHIMAKDYKSAMIAYQSVLKWAADYNEKKIHVDTLLQIHAVHNMLDIAGNLSPEDIFNKAQYTTKLTELEWKYIETYKNKVKEVEDRLLNVQRDLKVLDVKELCTKGDAWWRHVLYDAPNQDALLEKLLLDMKDVGMTFEPKSIRAVDLHLTMWIEKVNARRRDIRKNFKNLEYFHGNLKPKNKLTEDELFKIAYLVGSSYDCHLFVNSTESDEENERPEPKRTCQMCRAKTKLDEYECTIFNKRLFGENEIRGSWNPCEQEYVFKTLLAYAKRSSFQSDVIEAGDAELKYIEGIKNEFKEYSQYWVEINYTVSAYDELNMCKSRLEDVDMMDDDIPENTDPRKNNMRIPRHMIAEVQNEMQAEKTNAENNFVRIKGRLKYLEHLKDNQKPEVCPICKQDPEERYAVLQCGHSLCIICVNSMAKYQRNRLSCALCRHVQQYRDVFYVTLTPKDCEVSGNFSAKIIAIVKEVLKIRYDESTVKIVIFSQWENILTMIKSALHENNITFAMHTSAGHRGAKSKIEEFKKGPQTCLLMPLAAGSKGLNLTEATHVFLVEPILNPSEELQAVGRVHRIGQTRPTFVHRFIMKDTIEETIYDTVANDKSGIWKSKNMTVDDLKKLFELPSESVEYHTEASFDFRQ